MMEMLKIGTIRYVLALALYSGDLPPGFAKY